MLEVPLDTPCPVCGAEAFFQNTIELDVPYFGNILSLVFLCKQCRFRQTDVLITDIKSPTRFSFRIGGVEDLNVRVVRSSSGTIRMPELGILVEPGENAEAFVTNVEGILVLFENAVAQAIRFSDDPEAKPAGAELLQRLQSIRRGEEAATLVIDDPFGNSAILSPKADQRMLTAEEVEQLETGMVILERRTEQPDADGPG